MTGVLLRSKPHICFYRRILFFLTLLVLFAGADTALAAKLHLLIVADTDDIQIGDDVRVDISSFLNTFNPNVPPEQLRIRVMEGREVTRENIFAAIQGLQTAQDDAILFAYAGHGLYDKSVVSGREKGHALQLFNKGLQPQNVQMQIAGSTTPFSIDKSKLVYRSELLQALQNKNARLRVVFTDCCNSFVKIVEPPLMDMVMSAPMAAESSLPKVVLRPLFRQLFFTHSGLIDLGTSAPGELAYGNAKSGGFGTDKFCEFLGQNRDSSVLNWYSVFDQVKQNLLRHFSKEFPQGADRSKQGMPRQTTQTLHKFGFVVPPRFGITVVNDPQGRGVVITRVSEPQGTTGIPARNVTAVVNGQQVTGRLNVGDIITNINNAAVLTEQDFARALDTSPRQMTFRMLDKNSNFQVLDCRVELSF